MKRLNYKDVDQNLATENFASLYNPNLTTDNFVRQGLLVKDISGRSVGVASGELRGDMIHTGEPYAEIMVIGLKKGTLAGWVLKDKMIDAGDRYLVPLKSLNSLPPTLNFAVECAHLSVHGGFYNHTQENWECFGCGKIVVFAE